MWNQVSTHYGLGLTSLHCQWPVNSASRPELSRNNGGEWKKKKCCLSAVRTQRDCQSAFCPIKQDESWKVGHCPTSRIKTGRVMSDFFYPFFFLSFLFAAFALRRFSNRVGRLRPSTSRSQSAAAEDSDWARVADVWPRPRPDIRIMADGVRQRPLRDASWVERVLFFQEGGGQLWKQKKKKKM